MSYVINKVDREILAVLKVIFQFRRGHFLASDHHLRLWVIRSTFFISILSLGTRIVAEILGQDITVAYAAITNLPIAFFITLLFIHINNEVEDANVIIFALTWGTLMLGLYA